PRWITSGRWRERTPRDRGPAAARPRPRRRRLRRAHLHKKGCRAAAGGRAARGYGAAPPASRLLRPAARRPAAGPDPGDLGGPSGRKYGQAPACPAPGAARPPVRARRTNGRQEPKVNWRSIVRRNGKITRIHYEEVSTVGGESRRHHQQALARLGCQVTLVPPGDGSPPPGTPSPPTMPPAQAA